VAYSTPAFVLKKRRLKSVRRDSPARVEISDGVTWRNVGDDVVILNLDSGIYFGLDGSGGQIWRELAEHGAVEKAFESLKREFDIDPGELRRDLDDLLNRLLDKGLMRPVVQPAGKSR